jgi:hypothetical protein
MSAQGTSVESLLAEKGLSHLKQRCFTLKTLNLRSLTMAGLPRYLSSAPVLAVVSISVAFTAFMLINWVSPDLLFLAE